RSGPGAGAAVDIIPAVKIGLQNIDAGKSCGIYVNSEPIGTNAFDELRKFLEGKRAAGADATNPVVIGAESSVRWKHIVRAMDECVGAGFQNVQFAVRLDGPSAR
ncbi:MAG: biopolymer transporter ExbD, partial [Phycisphaerales bacterium]|nr:biopolymer transporter ExbD [Phycisphaerales bacterium]